MLFYFIKYRLRIFYFIKYCLRLFYFIKDRLRHFYFIKNRLSIFNLKKISFKLLLTYRKKTYVKRPAKSLQKPYFRQFPQG
jgi:hypothetical protein